MKKISRKGFLKLAAAAAMGGVTAGALSACESASSTAASASSAAAQNGYTAGTYTATAAGINGDVSVTMTFDAEKITEVVIDASGETESIGGVAAEELANTILEAQTSEVDAVSGATITSNAIKEAAAKCIAEAKGVDPESLNVQTETISWRTAPEAIPEENITDTLEADVVVIGLGQAGLACARAAMEGGASVIVIEKMSEENHAWTGCDFGHINSQWLKDQGIPEVDPVEVLNDWQLRGCNMSNPTLVMKYLKNCGETFDWFMELGDEEGKKQLRAFHNPYPKNFKGELAGQKFWNGTAQFPGIFFEGDYTVTAHSKLITQYIIEKGVQVFYSNDAQYLEKDSTGRVTGVIAKTENGYVRYNGTKGVVLAAGDFSADAEMVDELCPNINALNYTGDGKKITGMDRDGKGIKMGVWAGGKLEPGPLSTMGGTFFFPSGLLGSCGNLWLDNDCNRFCNEAFGDPVFAGAEAARHKGTIYSVFDADIYEQLQSFPAGHGSAFVNDPTYKASLEKALADAVAAGDEGVDECLTMTGGTIRLFAADTLDQLADRLGLTGEKKENLLSSVENYNAKCAAGYDDDYGKDPSVLFPVAKAPYYGFAKDIYAGYEFLCTTGGLWTDNDQNVYDEHLDVIPGLYATGNCCGRRFGVQYSTPIAGVSVGMAQTLGRELGKHLASL